ncbi:MAG: LysR family transcriptional regulator [Proteobacteria bacterium]|nr:LysR family transcriptional regulator [Pseudomonadota bacterium]MBU1583369.1 LysR family transcriptional regulator [Pseudomonadota bacterium]MBU2455563.1 LysR family transcriptional regulator [Pseudomonadota bacterium]MBU2627601.1 LysR family transcriptional regulator [Pseudomonadota bacterium]
MDLYHLKTFFVLAKIKNFTKTADRLFVTQSAVSHAIKKLENSIETQLIARKGKQLVLTEAGNALYRSCEKIFYEIEKADQDIAHFRKKVMFSICIGSTVEFGTAILIKHIKGFLDENPDIHLDFLFSHHLIDPLIQDEVDLIIDCKPHQHKHLEKIHLFREQYITIASPHFIKTENIVSLDDLERVNILSNDKDLEWWHNFLTAIPDEKQDCLKNVVQINHIRGLINGAIAGLGIGFVPKYTVMKELEEKILLDPFPQIKPAADDFNIYIKKEKLKFQKNQLLTDYLTRLKISEFGVD